MENATEKIRELIATTKTVAKEQHDIVFGFSGDLLVVADGTDGEIRVYREIQIGDKNKWT